MRKIVEPIYGPIRTLQTDQDTSYLKTFQKHLDKNNIKRKNDARFNKISNTERVGGLFKRHLATISKEQQQPWYTNEVFNKAVNDWNNDYPSRLRPGEPPKAFNRNNFDQLLELLYEKDPVELHALYPVGHSFTDGELSEIFKYRPGDLVYVSLKTISKRMQSPVSRLFSILDTHITNTFFLCSLQSIIPNYDTRVGLQAKSWPEDLDSLEKRRQLFPFTSSSLEMETSLKLFTRPSLNDVPGSDHSVLVSSMLLYNVV